MTSMNDANQQVSYLPLARHVMGTSRRHAAPRTTITLLQPVFVQKISHFIQAYLPRQHLSYEHSGLGISPGHERAPVALTTGPPRPTKASGPRDCNGE